MKHILLIISLLTATYHISKAQAYIPFPNSACWKYQIGCFEQSSQLDLTMNGDTLIDGKVYKKLSYISYQADGTGFPCCAYTVSSSPYIGGLREDSLKNIWFRSCCESYPIDITAVYCGSNQQILPINEDILIYKFGAAVGDTLPFNNSNTNQPLIVTAIDSVSSFSSYSGETINFGNYRKRYAIKGLNYLYLNNDSTQYEDKCYWIEGVGSLEHLLVVLLPAEGGDIIPFDRWYMRAFVSNPSTSCFLGVDETLNNVVVNITPNPTNQYLQYSYKGAYTPNLFVHIYNLQGTLIATASAKNAHSFTHTFDLSNLAAGLYVVQTISNQGSSLQKIIKQ